MKLTQGLREMNVILIDSDFFSVSGYAPLFSNDSLTPMHGLPVYLKNGLTFACRKLCGFFFFLMLFGCLPANFGPLLRGQPYSPDVNHYILSTLDLKVTGSLIIRLGPQA